VGEDRAADPGFSGGGFAPIEATAIPSALRARAENFVAEPDGRRTLLVPVTGRRGHDLGMIGLTVGPDAQLPDTTAIRGRIAQMIAVQPSLPALEAAE
jgi:hypothetical protein